MEYAIISVTFAILLLASTQMTPEFPTLDALERASLWIASVTFVALALFA